MDVLNMKITWKLLDTEALEVMTIRFKDGSDINLHVIKPRGANYLSNGSQFPAVTQQKQRRENGESECDESEDDREVKLCRATQSDSKKLDWVLDWGIRHTVLTGVQTMLLNKICFIQYKKKSWIQFCLLCTQSMIQRSTITNVQQSVLQASKYSRITLYHNRGKTKVWKWQATSAHHSLLPVWRLRL